MCKISCFVYGNFFPRLGRVMILTKVPRFCLSPLRNFQPLRATTSQYYALMSRNTLSTDIERKTTATGKTRTLFKGGVTRVQISMPLVSQFVFTDVLKYKVEELGRVHYPSHALHNPGDTLLITYT